MARRVYQYVLNPDHPDFARIRIGQTLAFPFDARLGAGPR
jgi:hypothetical protein